METTVLNRNAHKSKQGKKSRNAHFEFIKMQNHPDRAILSFIKNYRMIYLLKSRSRLSLTNKGIEAHGPALVLVDPLLQSPWETASENDENYSFLFANAFAKADDGLHGNEGAPFAGIGSNAIFYLNDPQMALFSSMFEKLTVEMDTENVYKYDIIQNCIRLILHEAIPLQPVHACVKGSTAAKRITWGFKELLNKQFPVDSPQYPLGLRTARDFAKQLSVHVNHLNSAVRSVTGKTTTAHITERIILEAKALLRHTNWNVSEIAYSLGFEYPTYFNNFFKKQTQVNPLHFRT